MTSRDQTLALILIGVMALTVGAAGGYLFVWEPIQKNRAEEVKIQDDISKLETLDREQTAKVKALAAQRVRSLPADQTLARQEYIVALERLLATAVKAAEDAGVPKGEVKYAISPKPLDNSARAVPEVTKGKPVYTRVAYEVTIKKANMWVVKDFLKAYYDLDLLQQITHFSIKKDDDNSAKGAAVKRNDLSVTFTTEAILVDGAENRKTLFPVPTAFAAIGGGGLYQVMGRTTETGRGASPRPSVPVLATKSRDYSLIVLKDPFNGPLPAPPAFKLSPIKDVKIVQDEKPAAVKVAVSGEGAVGTKVVAVAKGALFPEGALKVDPKTLAIELPRTSASEGTATIDVIATSADGKTEQTAFKVSVEKKEDQPEKVDTRDDVSAAIILTMVTFRSDGTASAAIRDSANRQRYEIEVEGKKVTISKFWYIKDKKKADDPITDATLTIADDTSKTKRVFKIVAVDAEGLILEDQKPGTAPKPAAAPAPKGFGPPKFGERPRQGPAVPVAAIAGNMANGVPVAPNKLYRWTVGQSLAKLELISDSEATKIRKQAADNGPMFELATAGK